MTTAATYDGHCMKCKQRREMVNVSKVTMKNRNQSRAVQGKCSVCGSGMFRIMRKGEQ